MLIYLLENDLKNAMTKRVHFMDTLQRTFRYAERNEVKEVEDGFRAAHRTGFYGKAATGSACYSG